MLSANQLRLLTALKTALAVVIALGIAMKLNWDKPYWTGITVMIVSLPYVGAALEKCFLRILGTLAAGVFAFLLTGWFEQDQVLMSVALFAILAGAGYGAMGKTYPYFFLLGGITLCIIIATTVENPDELWPLVRARTLEVMLGVVVALTVNSLILPQRASNALRHKISGTLGECRDLLELALGCYLDGMSLPHDLKERERAIAAKFPALLTLLQSALRDSSRLLHHHQAAEETIRETRQCFVALTTSLRAATSDSPRELQKEMAAELRAYTDALLSDVAQVITDLNADQPPRELIASRDAREALEHKVMALRNAGVTFGYPIEDVSNFFAFVGDLDSFHAALVRLAKADRILYRDVEADHLPKRIHIEPREWSLDHRRLQHGVKVGIACLVSLYAYLWLRWPGGITAFVTCAIVVQVSISASNQKSMLRLGGCLLGGFFGAFTLAFIEPYIATYIAYSVPLFVIFFIFAWINNGPQKYAYAGFQAHLAFLLMTSISAQQSVDLEAGVDRFLGILLGVFIAALVQRLIWPVLPEREFRRELSLFFKRAATFLREQDDRIARQQNEPDERAQEKELSQLEYLPAKTLDWLAQIGFSNHESAEKDALTHTFLHIQAITFALRGMAQANARQHRPEVLRQLRPELVAIDHALADALKRCQQAFDQIEPFTPEHQIKDAVLQLEHRIPELTRVEHATRSLNGEELGGLLALTRRYREIATLVAICEKQVATLNFRVLERSAFF